MAIEQTFKHYPIGRLISLVLVVGCRRRSLQAHEPVIESGGRAAGGQHRQKGHAVTPPAVVDFKPKCTGWRAAPSTLKDNIVPSEIASTLATGLIAPRRPRADRELGLFKNGGFKVKADHQRGRELGDLNQSRSPARSRPSTCCRIRRQSTRGAVQSSRAVRRLIVRNDIKKTNDIKAVSHLESPRPNSSALPRAEAGCRSRPQHSSRRSPRPFNAVYNEEGTGGRAVPARHKSGANKWPAR